VSRIVVTSSGLRLFEKILKQKNLSKSARKMKMNTPIHIHIYTYKEKINKKGENKQIKDNKKKKGKDKP
jgi:H2-forming N5,N10-methylenetetrahydromethanopterin dehydrogenase-like enzyme